MSNTYYGVTIPGAAGNKRNVTKAAATTGANCELVVLDGVAGNSKHELLKALEAIANFIREGDAPA